MLSIPSANSESLFRLEEKALKSHGQAFTTLMRLAQKDEIAAFFSFLFPTFSAWFFVLCKGVTCNSVVAGEADGRKAKLEMDFHCQMSGTNVLELE